MKKIVLIVIVLLMMTTSTALASTDKWKILEGGQINGERVAFTVKETSEGIKIEGTGGYDDTIGSAAGVVLTQSISNSTFSLELQIDQIAGLSSNGADHFFAVNLLNTPNFFSIQNTGLAEGLNILLRPYADGLINVWVYGLTKKNGWTGIAGTDQVKWDNKKVLIEFVTNTANGNVLTVNGVEIYGDLSSINNSLFKDGKAYFSTGASDPNGGEFAYTIKKVNGSKITLDGDVAVKPTIAGATVKPSPTATAKPSVTAKPAATAPSVTENPKTGDAGLTTNIVISLIAIILLLATRKRIVK